MDYLFLLSGENVELAKEEVLSLIKYKNYFLKKRLLVIKTNKKLNGIEERLAFTHRIYLLLFESNLKNLIKNIENFDWKTIYKKDFCVRINNSNNKIKKKYNEKKLASYIWKKLKNPRVNLENPKTLIEFYFLKDKVYCGLLIKKIEKDFEKRKAHLRPEFSPTSLHPKLARALVNLTGIKKGKILDPFCGTGGILIEAGLMGVIPIGFDNNKLMLEKCKKNLNYFKIKKYKLKLQDATKINEKHNYIVADLPYGKSSPSEDKNLNHLYYNLLKNLKKNIGKRAVIVFPDFIYYKKLVKKSKLIIENQFSVYIHKSLTKKILVLKK